MPVLIVTCGILVGMLSLAAFTPARAGLNGVPGWWGRRHCPPGHWKKGWC